MSLYFAALKDPGAEPLAPSAFLTGRPGLDRGVVTAFLRRNPAFLGRNLAEPAAAALAAEACKAGLPAMMAREEDLPGLPKALRAAKLSPGNTGLEICAAGTKCFVPYEDINLLAAGAFDAPTRPLNTSALKDSLFTQIHNTLTGRRPLSTELNPPRETFFRAELFVEGGLRYKLDPEILDYSALAGEKTYSSVENLRLLLARISAVAFKARKNAFLGAFLAGRPLAPLKLASEAACELDIARLILATTFI